MGKSAFAAGPPCLLRRASKWAKTMAILGSMYFGRPPEEHPERAALAAYNLGRHPFLLRIWPEYISWASMLHTADLAAGYLGTYAENERPDSRKVRHQHARKQRHLRRRQLQLEGRDTLPGELQDLKDALKDLAQAKAAEPYRLFELRLDVDRLRDLFQAALDAYTANDVEKLEWLLWHEEDPWHDLVDQAATAVQGNPEAQRWCELGRWVGMWLACAASPQPLDIIPADVDRALEVAATLAPERSTLWRQLFDKFAVVAKKRPKQDWLSKIHASAVALTAADAAIREGLEAAAGRGPWLIIDHVKQEIVLFGRSIPFKRFKPYGLRLFLALASRPNQKISDVDLLKMADLKKQPGGAAEYISRAVRPVLKPIVTAHGPATGINDRDTIDSALVLGERKSYQSGVIPTGYRLAIPPRLVRHIGTPLLAQPEAAG